MACDLLATTLSVFQLRAVAMDRVAKSFLRVSLHRQLRVSEPYQSQIRSTTYRAGL